MTSRGTGGAMVALLPTLLLLAATPRAHDPIGSVTWARDVEPVIRDRCFACHAADGPALPRLASYEDVVANGAAVKTAVMARRMPIWAPVRGVGRFAHDPSLSPYQISLVASWVESRTPRGVPAALKAISPADTALIDPLGSPVDIELHPPANVTGVDRETIRLSQPAAAGIVGWRFEPGDPTLRRAVFTDASGRVLWTWVPGLPGENFPKGTALEATGSALSMETTRRMQGPDGRPRAAKAKASRLRLWFAPRALRSVNVVSIPCGTRTSFRGHVYAVRPSSPRESRAALVHERQGNDQVIAAFAPLAYQHPRSYWLRDPVVVTAGSVLRAEGEACTLDLLVSAPVR